MKKIDKAVEIFLKRENMEEKAEIPGFIKALKETLVDQYCPSAFDLVNRTGCCQSETVERRCRECWGWTEEVS